MTKKEIVNGYRQMRQDINKQKDEYLSKMYPIIKKYFNGVPNRFETMYPSLSTS